MIEQGGAYTHQLTTPLDELFGLPDDSAAIALNERMAVLDEVDRIHERSYAERGQIAREFEKRLLWRHLIDPVTNEPFTSWSKWMASGFIGCRRTNFEAARDMQELADIPSEKLREIPKGNIKVLKQLSTSVRNDEAVLGAARTMSQAAFVAKIEAEIPDQHIESRRPLRFSPERSGAAKIEEAIEYAIENEIASNRDEALVRMAETALDLWSLETEPCQ